MAQHRFARARRRHDQVRVAHGCFHARNRFDRKRELRLHLCDKLSRMFAVATDDALLVPVVSDADRKTLMEIAAETRRLTGAARRRGVHPEDLRDGTFTVSNLGMFGVRAFTAIIDPPQVAILAVGGLRGDLMTVTLSCDHRVVYGADGARFLSRLRELIERPLALVS